MGSSELYRTLVEQSAEGLWVLDDDGRTVFANPRLAQLLGVPRDELVGRDHADFLDDAGRTQWHLRRARLAEEGVSRVPVECRFVRADGSAAWFLVTEAQLADDDGAPGGLLLSLSEHDERRRALDDLARSRGELLAAQRIARLGSWAWDAVADSLTVSPALRHLFDHDPAVFPMRLEQALELFDEPERERLRTLNAPLLEGEAESSDFEVATTGADGPVWLRVRAVPDRDGEGVVRGLAGTLQDVTQTHLEEDALRDLAHQNALMQRVAVAANQSPTLVDALLATGELVVEHDDWTHARAFWPAEDGSGDLEPGPAIGRPELGEPDPALTARELRTARRAYDAGVSTWDDEEQLTLASPVMLGDEPVAVIAISSEPPLYRHAIITSMLEQVVLQLSTVAQREAGARELAAARDTAMEASRQKSEFLATMSHEIRTPLNGVIGLNDLLRATDLDAHQHRLTTGVAASGRALLAIVDDILDFSKIEAGLLEIEALDLDPRQVLDDVAAMTAQAAGARGVRLVVHCAREVPSRARGDRARLTQVLANLVSNAVKFTEPGGEVLVHAGLGAPGSLDRPSDDARPADEAGSTEAAYVLDVAVTDTGVGIAPERLQGIFEPFIQADASTTREYGGTGLGLAIVREIVNALGGVVRVASEPGVGSTFRFRVPLAAAEGPDPEPAPGLAGRSALVVESCPGRRQADVETLAHWGLEVVGIAPDGVAAQLRAHGAPDVALLGRGDAEPADRVAEESALAALRAVAPLVVLDGPGRRTAPEPGVQCLERPVPAARLREVVAAAARGEQAAPEPVGGPHRPPAATTSDPGGADGAPAGADRGRVLVVEDTPINQMVAEGLLSALGYASESVGDGVDALARLDAADADFDLVLMDVQMPRLDGYATSRAIREREQARGLPRLPIVAMTAAAVTGERERCLAAGMDDYLTKPVSPARLATVLADRLSASATDRATRTRADGDPARLVHGNPDVTADESEGGVVASSGPSADGGAAGPPVPAELAVHLDLERLDMLRDLDPGNTTYVDRVVGNFVARTPALHEAVAAAVEAGDPAALSAVAHRLRGSALNLGVPRVAEIALELELAGERGDLGGAVEVVRDLAAALEVGRDAVLAYRASHGS